MVFNKKYRFVNKPGQVSNCLMIVTNIINNSPDKRNHFFYNFVNYHEDL